MDGFLLFRPSGPSSNKGPSATPQHPVVPGLMQPQWRQLGQSRGRRPTTQGRPGPARFPGTNVPRLELPCAVTEKCRSLCARPLSARGVGSRHRQEPTHPQSSLPSAALGCGFPRVCGCGWRVCSSSAGTQPAAEPLSCRQPAAQCVVALGSHSRIARCNGRVARRHMPQGRTPRRRPVLAHPE